MATPANLALLETLVGSGSTEQSALTEEALQSSAATLLSAATPSATATATSFGKYKIN